MSHLAEFVKTLEQVNPEDRLRKIQDFTASSPICRASGFPELDRARLHHQIIKECTAARIAVLTWTSFEGELPCYVDITTGAK